MHMLPRNITHKSITLFMCLFISPLFAGENVDPSVSQGLNRAPLDSALAYLSSGIDFRTIGTTIFNFAPKIRPFDVGDLTIGYSFEGQYMSGNLTGTTSDLGPKIKRFPKNRKGLAPPFMTVTRSGLTTGRITRYNRYTGYGATAEVETITEEILGTSPLSIVFPVAQYAFGIEVERLFRMEQTDRPAKDDNHIRVKAFNSDGNMIGERRFAIGATFSAAFVRCQYTQDVTAIQITSSVQGGIALGSVTYDNGATPPPVTAESQETLPEGFEYLPCLQLMG
ncbi:hypothetical protein DL239_09100 [Sedimentitalea sp. CY04]|uniref:Uncharacterized protein n=1 Tax=Parasedimentitalea denitrificans TaxID=2211118 RepID=A0ABX0W6C7_9RHOB|nr:NAD-glutamate dehydrogenase [Sedimentitalea sp. CY04]NIZ61132.1 hypothetical protein [Sedimentitalea sp. CY04]